MRFPVAIVAVFLLINGSLPAQVVSSGVWSAGANWSGGTLPPNNGTANVIVRRATTMNGDWDVSTLSWTSTSLQSGTSSVQDSNPVRTLTVRNGVSNTSGGRVVFEPNMSLAQVQTFHDDSTPGAYASGPGTIIEGIVSGSGGIIKTGSGVLNLKNGSNSYSGGTTINVGILTADSAGALGTGTVSLNGGALRLRSASTLTQNITVGAGGGTIEARGGTLTLGGAIDGSGQLRLANDADRLGNARFAMSLANTYGGGTVIEGVAVSITGTQQSLGSGGVTLRNNSVLALGAVSNLAVSQKVAVQKGGVLVLPDISEAATLVDSANTTGGTVAFTGTRAAVVDMAAIGNGEMFLGTSGTAVYSASTLGVGAGATYRLGGGSSLVTTATTVVSNPPTLVLNGSDNVLTGTNKVVFGHSENFNSEATGSSNTVLLRANDYSGGTTIQSGLVLLGHDQALGSGTIVVNSGTALTFTGIGTVDGTGPRTIANNIQFANSNTNSTVRVGASTATTFTGEVDLGGLRRTISGFGALAVFTNTISNGELYLVGGQTWRLQGQNTFNGLSVADSGTVEVWDDRNLGGAGTITLNRSTLKIMASGTNTRSIVTVNSGTIDVAAGVNYVLTGTVNNGFGKTGDGTVVLKDTLFQAGGVSISAGTVLLQDVSRSNSFSVSISSGATLEGDGAISSLFASTGSRISVGHDGEGVMRFTGNTNLSGGCNLDFELGLLSDEYIEITGVLRRQSGSSAAPFIINISDLGGLDAGQTYRLMDWGGGTSEVTLSDFVLGSTAFAGYLDIADNQLRFTTVPEPSTYAMVVLAFFGLWILRRRASSRRA